MPIAVAGVTVTPQVQASWQRLKFDRARDADGVAVALGTLTQWRVRAGGQVGKVFDTPTGTSIQLYGKAHLAHHLGDGEKVHLAQDFRLGKSGTMLETGVGLEANFAQNRAAVYADLTRQTRLSRAGHQGWSANVGVRVRF